MKSKEEKSKERLNKVVNCINQLSSDVLVSKKDLVVVLRSMNCPHYQRITTALENANVLIKEEYAQYRINLIDFSQETLKKEIDKISEQSNEKVAKYRKVTSSTEELSSEARKAIELLKSLGFYGFSKDVVIKKTIKY